VLPRRFHRPAPPAALFAVAFACGDPPDASTNATSSSAQGTGGQAPVDAGTTGSGTGGGGGSPEAGGADVSGQSDAGDAGDADACAEPGTICWDFEEGRIPNGWVPYRNEFAGTLVVDATRAHGGRYALHAKDFAGGVEGQQGGPKHTIRFDLPASFGPTLWGRAYVYTTPARPMSHAGLFNARYPRPNAPSTAINALDWYEVATYTQKYMTVWHPPEPPGYPEWVQVSDATLVLDAWACLEWSFDGANGANPEAADPRMWLDGNELAWPDRFVFADPPTTTRPTQEKAQSFTVLETGVYLYQGLSTTTNWWIDDLAVGKRRIGCR
jgi:hypothetical protein